MSKEKYFRGIVLAIILIGINQNTAARSIKSETHASTHGDITYVEIQINDYDFQIKGPAGTQLNENYLSKRANATRASVIINGGYMSGFTPPKALGLVRINKKNITTSHNTWLGEGMICFTRKKVFIGTFKQEDMLYDDCLQSGPLIVQNGKNRYSGDLDISAGEKRLENSVQNQSFACSTTENSIILGVSKPITLRELTDTIIQLGCNNALRLSGAETAGMVVDGRLYGNSDLPLHNVIIAKMR